MQPEAEKPKMEPKLFSKEQAATLVAALRQRIIETDALAGIPPNYRRYATALGCYIWVPSFYPIGLDLGIDDRVTFSSRIDCGHQFVPGFSDFFDLH